MGSGPRPAAFAVPGSAVAGGVGCSPLPEERPREDAGRVAVVPGEVDAPCPDELGVVGPEGEGRRGLGPDRKAAFAQAATFGARAVDAKLLERIASRHAVGPGGGEVRGSVAVERRRRWGRLLEGRGGRGGVGNRTAGGGSGPPAPRTGCRPRGGGRPPRLACEDVACRARSRATRPRRACRSRSTAPRACDEPPRPGGRDRAARACLW